MTVARKARDVRTNFLDQGDELVSMLSDNANLIKQLSVGVGRLQLCNQMLKEEINK